MDTLDDVIGTQQGSLDDVLSTGANRVPISITPSNINMAAQVAAMGTPEETERAYRTVNSELNEDVGGSVTAEAIIKMARDKSHFATRNALVEFLADPSVSDEDKEAAASGVLDVTNEQYGLGNMLSYSALEEETDVTNNEVETTRVSMAGAIQEVNNWRRYAQMRVNQEAAATNPGSLNAAADIFEYFTPFVEQKAIGSLLSRMRDGDGSAYAEALGMLGDSKKELRDMVLAVPPSERLPFTEAIIEFINQSSNITLINENDYAKMDMMRTVLEGGYYSNTDRWIDNAVSLLDLAGGIGLGMRASLRASRAARSLDGEFIPKGNGGAPSGGRAGDTVEGEFTREFETTGGQVVVDDAIEGEFLRGGKPGPNRQSSSRDVSTEVIYDVTLSGNPARRLTAPEPLRLTGPTTDSVNATRTRVQPASVSQAYKDTNNARARAAHEASVADETGEAAQAIYGAGRADVVAHDVLPEIAIPSGRVKAKVSFPDYIYQMAKDSMKEVFDYAKNTGGSAYFQKEKEAMRALVRHDFEQAQGITPRKEMFQLKSRPDGVSIRAMYGPANSGFSNPFQAVDTVKVALRKYGIDDKNVTLYARNGSEYEPITLKELEGRALIVQSVKGRPDITRPITNQDDFLVAVDYDYKFNPFDVLRFEETTVEHNLFDRMGVGIGSGGRGSLTRHLFDPASMFDPVIVKSLSAAIDKSAELEQRMVNLAREFSDPMGKLPVERQEKVANYLMEANSKGIGFDPIKLDAEGFMPSEVEVMRAFRDFWDTVHWLRNRDFAMTLRGQGYFEFLDEATQTRMMVKPVTQRPNKAKVYDQVADKIVVLNRAQIDEIYDGGGTLAKSKTPIEMGEETVDLLVAPNTAGKPYLRAITENSEVLNYREGYFPVAYTDRVFIDRVYVPKDGGEPEIRAVGTAGSIKDAELMTRRFNTVSGNEQVSFRHRPDKRDRTKSEAFDDDWNLSTARGMSAQKVRGMPLQASTSNVDDLANAPIQSPIDTMISNIRSVSNRVSMREVLDPYKHRVLAQYGDYLPKDRYGNAFIPSSTKDVAYNGLKTPNSTDLGAARSHVEYIQYLENGYINDIDDVYKKTLKGIARITGEKGFKGAEKAFSWLSETRGPTQMGKNLAFQMLIATNPIRQVIVQSHQATQLLANFPQYAASLRGPSEMILLTSFELGAKPPGQILKALNMSMTDAEAMYDQWRKSGFSASVDKQNLIRGALLDMADRQRKGIPVVTPVLAGVRKVGFDAGETFNLMTSWLAHRDKAVRDGLDVNDLGVIEDFTAKARNYTYSMNLAGDMPYNQNAANLLLMYFQVPHKALLSMTTNRMLSAPQKLRLIGYNMIMNPLPAAVSLGIFGGMLPPDDSKTIVGLSQRDIVLSGLEGAVLNKLLTLYTGEETYINWSGLAPLDMYGMYETLHGFATMDPGEIIASTPVGQMFLGQNPRITNLFKSAARFTNVMDEDFESATPTEVKKLLKDFASLSSGMSNVFKARLAYNAGRKINTVGGLTDPESTEAEAVFQLAGMNTRDEVIRFWMNDKMYEKSGKLREDVETMHKDLKRLLLTEGITVDQSDYYLRALSAAWIAFGNDNYRAKEIFDQLLQDDMQATGQAALYNQILSLHGVMSNDELRTLINATPDMPQDKKEDALGTIDAMERMENR